MQEFAKQGKNSLKKILVIPLCLQHTKFYIFKLAADGEPGIVKLFTVKINLRANFQREDSYQVLCPSGHLTSSNASIFKS